MKCLMVIDVQNGFVTSETSYIVPKIESLMDKFKDDMVIATKFVNTENSGFTDIMKWEELKESPETDLLESIERRAKIVVEKNIYSACNQEVLNILQDYDIEEVYIVGIDTDCCVLKTAIDLFEKNIRPIVLTEYCASTGGIESHRAAIKVLERTIGIEQIV